MAKKKSKKLDVRIFQRNGIYQYAFRDHRTGGYIRKSAETREYELAKARAMQEFTNSYQTRHTGDPVGWTINQLLDWATQTIWTDLAQPENLRYAIKPIRDYFGEIEASKLGVADILRFRASVLADGLKMASVLRPLDYLHSAYEAAIDCEKLVTNPVHRARRLAKRNGLFTAEKVEGVALDHAEQVNLIDEVRGMLRDIVIVALRSGMRQGEILGLRKADVNLITGVMLATSYKGKGKKTKVRPVPILSDVYDILLRYLADPTPSEFVFHYENGKPLSRNGVVHTSFMRACDRLASGNLLDGRQVMPSPKFKKVTFHSLRHTFITDMTNLGANAKKLRDIVGHSDQQTTEIYTHLNLSSLAAEMKILPSIQDMRNLSTNLTHQKSESSEILENR